MHAVPRRHKPRDCGPLQWPSWKGAWCQMQVVHVALSVAVTKITN